MNAQEAINRIKEHKDIHFKQEPWAIYITGALDMAIRALEKQIPKKVIFGYDEQDSILCPFCRTELALMDSKEYEREFYKYCPNCGCKLDWSATK